MKKLIAVAASAIALASMAAMEEVAKVRIADAAGLVSAVTKIGEMSGNGMIGAVAAAQINELELFKFFGPARSGASIALSVMADGDKLDESVEAWGDTVGAAVLYPIEGKTAFLARYAGAVETNGFVTVKSDSCKTFSKAYLVFSPDGKWVAASDKAELAKSALGLVPEASKPMGADVVKASVGPKAMKVLVTALEKVAAESSAKGEKIVSEKDLAYLKGFASVSIAVRVNSSGVDLRTKLGAVKGSELDKMGVKTLAKAPLAFAGANAVSASAAAEGVDRASVRDIVDVIVAALAKRGVKLDFLGLKSVPGRITFDLDVPALVKYVEGDGAAAFGKIDPEELVAELRPAIEAATSKVSPSDRPAFSAALCIKNFTPKASVATRFEKTLPEVAGKPLYVVSASSLYSLVKGVVPQVVASISPELSGQVKPLLAALPEEGERGMATAYWRDGDAHVGIFRISADEIRGLGAAVNAAMGFAMANAMQGAGCVDDDDEEDSDDED